MAPDPAAEPLHGFDDSRRLTGPNRWFAGPAVTLTPRGAAARDPRAHADWAARVGALCARLGWPDPAPVAAIGVQEVSLVFAAPEDLLFTATEVNEWAWERAAAAAGETSFDLAQDRGDDPAGAAARFAARAAAEADPALAALRRGAASRGLPLLVDDEQVSIGAGSGSRVWPLPALPAPDDVPWPALHDVPTALVTGSNGKTTCVRLLAAIAEAAGFASGWCCTEGVFVAGQAVAAGDYAGPAGARAVLRDPQVALAVLETARGGILRRGLAVRRADVALVTNLSADHLGEYGIDSTIELAQVKLAVAHAVADRGTLVLPADDRVLLDAAAGRAQPAAARRALFALDDAHPALLAARDQGRSTCGVAAGRLRLWHAGRAHDLGAVDAMPMTLGGLATHNIANAAASALAAAAMGLAPAAIEATLRHFGSRPLDNPGRLERRMHRGATVLVDYAHNPEGLEQLLRVARALRPQRLGLLLGQAGNRDDAAIDALAAIAAGFAPDLVLIKELPLMLRGRAPGEVPARIASALRAAGLGAERLAVEADETAAAHALLAWAAPGDVVVLPVHTTAVREQLAAFLADRGG